MRFYFWNYFSWWFRILSKGKSFFFFFLKEEPFKINYTFFFFNDWKSSFSVNYLQVTLRFNMKFCFFFCLFSVESTTLKIIYLCKYYQLTKVQYLKYFIYEYKILIFYVAQNKYNFLQRYVISLIWLFWGDVLFSSTIHNSFLNVKIT